MPTHFQGHFLGTSRFCKPSLLPFRRGNSCFHSPFNLLCGGYGAGMGKARDGCQALLGRKNHQGTVSKGNALGAAQAFSSVT